MRLDPRVEKWRILSCGPWSSEPGSLVGVFVIPGPLSRDLKVLASPGNPVIPWEHVSVSARKTCPTWREMSFVKDLFFDPEEAVMQLHPPRSTWVNNHDTCLHLWRPLEAAIPLPPSIAVGVRVNDQEQVDGIAARTVNADEVLPQLLKVARAAGEVVRAERERISGPDRDAAHEALVAARKGLGR